MKASTRIAVALAAMLTFAGTANAVTFTVSDIRVTHSYDVNPSYPDNFEWSVDAGHNSSRNIAVGDSQTFTYGTFATTDFPIKNDELIDYVNGHIGTFTSGFSVSPPVPSLPVLAHIGAPEVTGTIKYKGGNNSNDYEGNAAANDGGVMVDFVNTPIVGSFGNGGEYTVVFNDIASITANGVYDLTATINLLRDSAPDAAPVPEPGTVMLLGAGFFGLALYGKRRRNA